MIRFIEDNGALIVRSRNETIRIEGWGNNALRVRATLLKKLPENAHALTENVAHSAKVTIDEGSETAEIVNGKIKATINGVGIICFYKDNELFCRSITATIMAQFVKRLYVTRPDPVNTRVLLPTTLR